MTTGIYGGNLAWAGVPADLPRPAYPGDPDAESLWATCPPRRCVRCEEPSEHETWQGYLCAECFERYCETAH